MSNTKSKDYEYLETSEEAKNRGLRRITSPKFVDSAIKKALKESKNRITIYLDADIVEYFKTEAENSKMGYQTLINQALREKINASQTVETAGDIIEKIIKDKTALSRLKAELETV